MKRIIIPLSLILCAVSGIWSYEKMKNAQEKMESDLLLANIEALATDETGTESKCKVKCKGLLGMCRYSCNNCGVSLNALGDEVEVEHKCSSTK